MRSVINGIIVASCLSVASSAGAAYVIKLKNGNEFVTGRYWESGKQVYFETVDGTFGVAKAMVTQIEKTDRPWRVARKAPPAEAPKIAEAADKKDAANADKSKTKPTVDSKKDEKEEKNSAVNDPILTTFNDIKRRAENMDSMMTSELQQIAKDLGSLKRLIQLSGKSNDYLEEFKEVHDLSDVVEAKLKSRL